MADNYWTMIIELLERIVASCEKDLASAQKELEAVNARLIKTRNALEEARKIAI